MCSYIDVLKDQRIFLILNEINKVFTLRVHKKTCTHTNTEKRAFRTMIADVSRSGERRADSFETMSDVERSGNEGGWEFGNEFGGEEQIPNRLQQWETMFCQDSEYARNLFNLYKVCLLYTSPSPRDRTRSRMPSSA